MAEQAPETLDDPKVGMVGPVTNFVGNEAKLQVGYRTWGEMEEFAQNQTWDNQGGSPTSTCWPCFASR